MKQSLIQMSITLLKFHGGKKEEKSLFRSFCHEIYLKLADEICSNDLLFRKQ